MIIIPTPKRIEEKKGTYYLPYSGQIVVNLSGEKIAKSSANKIKDALSDFAGLSYCINRGSMKGEILINVNEKLPKENYSLEISNDGVVITGGSLGVLYGAYSLIQIIMKYADALPFCSIEDYPVFKNRGFYHDITRGRVPKLLYLKKLADTLSFFKINQMQFYVEHCFKFNGLSEVWRDDTPITPEEILELDEYCDNIGVELVPSLSTFGHHYKLLNTETYGYLCEIDNSEFKEEFSLIDRMEHHTFNITDEGSFKLISDLIDEYIPLFKSNKFNICADETFDLGKGKSKALCDEVGLPRVYMDFVKKLCNKVIEYGKTPMLWGDIMLEFPEYVSELPKGSICLDWHYDENVKEDSVKVYSELPVDVYVCPGTNGWNMLINSTIAYENIKKMCSYGKKYEVQGVLNTDWGDFGHLNHPEHSIPALIYGAEGSWNGDIEEKLVFDEKISRLVFRNSTGNVLRIIDEISKCQHFDWFSLVWYKERLRHKPVKEKYEYVAKRLEKLSEDVLPINQRVDELVRELKNEGSHVDSGFRDMLYSYKLSAEGVKLFNLLGAFAIKGNRDIGILPVDLAVRLENWLYDYKNLWRTTSKESELGRIVEVIDFYCDLLRRS